MSLLQRIKIKSVNFNEALNLSKLGPLLLSQRLFFQNLVHSFYCQICAFFLLRSALSLFLHSFFFTLLCSFLLFACELKTQNSAGTHLWLLLSPITMESVQKSTEKLPPHVVMTSLVYILVQDNCRGKVIYLQYFLQGPCSQGQRRLCLGLCILSSLYAVQSH